MTEPTAPETAEPGEWTEANWSHFLTERFSLPIEVSYGRSRSAPVQARAFEAAGGQQGWQLRLHKLFATAPEEVRDALAKWLRAGRRARKAGPILDEWIHTEIASLPRKAAKVSINPAGDVHDLEQLALPLIVGEFANDFRPRGPHEHDVLARPGRLEAADLEAPDQFCHGFRCGEGTLVQSEISDLHLAYLLAENMGS